MGNCTADSSRQRQYSLLYAPNAVETNHPDVQYPTPGCDQSPSYSVTVASVYKVKASIQFYYSFELNNS